MTIWARIPVLTCLAAALLAGCGLKGDPQPPPESALQEQVVD